MKECPKCKVAFSESNTDDKRRFHDEIMKELLKRQKTSDLCLDCLMEDWVAKLGEAQLKQRHRETAGPVDDRQQQTVQHPQIL